MFGLIWINSTDLDNFKCLISKNIDISVRYLTWNENKINMKLKMLMVK